jgi:hypothetical protein
MPDFRSRRKPAPPRIDGTPTRIANIFNAADLPVRVSLRE